MFSFYYTCKLLYSVKYWTNITKKILNEKDLINFKIDNKKYVYFTPVKQSDNL